MSSATKTPAILIVLGMVLAIAACNDSGNASDAGDSSMMLDMASSDSAISADLTTANDLAGIDLSNRDDLTMGHDLAMSDLGRADLAMTGLSFAPVATYAVGMEPSALAAGDWNGDGKLDLVTSNLADSTLSFLFGNGDGTFQAAVAFPTHDTKSGPMGLAPGDYNGDGKLDIAYAEGNFHGVGVLLGDGKGGFPSGNSIRISNLGGLPGRLASGDWNGDGKLDLIAATGGTDDLHILLGNGDGTFTLGAVYAVGGGSPFEMATADFDGDNKLDVAVASYVGNSINVRRGVGDGTFGAEAIYGSSVKPWGIAMADLDGDGVRDLVVSCFVNFAGNGTVDVFKGGMAATFTRAATFATGHFPQGLALADLDSDGKLDVAIAQQGGMGILLGSGGGNFQPVKAFALPRDGYTLVTGRFDGDARPDIAVLSNAGGAIYVLLNATLP